MKDGAVIKVQRAPTEFGYMSIATRSELSKGSIIVDIDAPSRSPMTLLLKARVPDGWRVTSAKLADATIPISDSNTVDLSGRTGKLRVSFAVIRNTKIKNTMR